VTYQFIGADENLNGGCNVFAYQLPEAYEEACRAGPGTGVLFVVVVIICLLLCALGYLGYKFVVLSQEIQVGSGANHVSGDAPLLVDGEPQLEREGEGEDMADVDPLQ
ncbi:hypothetical protein KIPB_011586, partial [Kipferlia bialata]